MSKRGLFPELAAFLAEKAAGGLRPRSLDWWRGTLAPVLAEIGPRPTRDAVVAWLVAWRKHDKPSPGYYRGRVIALRAYLAAQGVMLGIRPPPLPRTEGMRLSGDDVARLMAQFGAGPHDIRDRAILALFLDSGLRLSELAGLRWEDVDWARGRLAIDGKGGHKRSAYFGEVARAALLAWSEDSSNASAVFPGRTGRPLTGNAIWRIVARRGKVVGLRLSPHMLRRTFATQWVRAGGNIFALQRLLGHSTLEMVRRYVALAESDLALANGERGILDSILSGRRRRKAA